jgi:hypothetical protein
MHHFVQNNWMKSCEMQHDLRPKTPPVFNELPSTIEKHLTGHKSKLTHKLERIHNSVEISKSKAQNECKFQWKSKVHELKLITFSRSAELWTQKPWISKVDGISHKTKVKVRLRLSFNFIASRNFFRRARDSIHFLNHEPPCTAFMFGWSLHPCKNGRNTWKVCQTKEGSTVIYRS